MHGLLGKISRIETKESNAETTTLEVTFKPVSVLPERSKVPEWLKDQSLKITRTVPDPREIGFVGDSIVIEPADAARWLTPLRVSPDSATGSVPNSLEIVLAWWKDEKAPEVTVGAAGRTITKELTKEDDRFKSTIETSGLFALDPQLPIQIDVACDKIVVSVAVLPQTGPFTTKLSRDGSEYYRVSNSWFESDLTLGSNAGGIASLVERGRMIDHFKPKAGVMVEGLEFGGHYDRFKSHYWRWDDKIKGVKVESVGLRKEAEGMRVSLECLVDDSRQLRTTAAYTFYDEYPLILVQREFQLGKPKEDKEKEKEGAVKELIDDISPFAVGLCTTTRLDIPCDPGSRALCTDGDALVSYRSVTPMDYMMTEGWWISDGWAVMEHETRREYLLELVDTRDRPHMNVWSSDHTIRLEPHWDLRPMSPGQSCAVASALCVGELCGASVEGAWVAVRVPHNKSGICVGIVGRFRILDGQVAAIWVGDVLREVELSEVLVPGVGALLTATIHFEYASLDQEMHGTAGGVASR